jgi:hypothetical protein
VSVTAILRQLLKVVSLSMKIISQCREGGTSVQSAGFLKQKKLRTNVLQWRILRMRAQGSNRFRVLGIALLVVTASAIAAAQATQVGSWSPLTNQPTFQTDTALLLTDATVMVHEYNSPNWWRLTPNNLGSYIHGTWSQLASMQTGYGPLYFASAVLPDGRVLVEGGEYNCCGGDEVTLGSIYDPTTNTWTKVNPPSGWTYIGDSPAVILPNGKFMMGQGASPSTLQVLFDASNLTWTSVGSGKADGFSEEGLALLPGGKVLTVDTEDGTNSETYNPSTAQWSSAGSTIAELPNAGGMGIVPEMGPLVQRPDGTVAAFGATTHTSVYDTATGKWTQGPDYPGGNMMADAPGSILPSGNVLVFTSPFFSPPGTFYEFDGTTFTQAPGTASSVNQPSFTARLLPLPSGHVLYTVADGGTIDVEVYTPQGAPNNAWRPTITSVPSTVTHGASYTIKGTQFNGLSAGAAYGDDAQMATNYPLVRIRNNATGHIFWARTHNHSTMGIATGSTIVSTKFDVPATIETGASTIRVVANGIVSAPKTITVN